MKPRRLLTALVAATTLVAIPASPASPATAEPNPVLAPQVAPATSASPDFDGDGLADFAATLYIDPDTELGGIRVWYGSGTTLDISKEVVGDPAAGAFSLASLLARDFNSDGYTDLAFVSNQAVNNALNNKVHLVFGSATGLKVGTLHSIDVPTATSDAVTELALVESPKLRLAVAVNGYQKATKHRVLLYDLTSSGLPTGTPITVQPGKGKVPALSARSYFGSAMASWGNQLFIGAPEATVSGKKSAGAVVVVKLSATGVSSARRITQSTAGVGSSAAKGDNFGQAVAARDGYLVVGTPNDRVGSAKASGSVQLFRLSGVKVTPVRRITQASSGVPGKAERGDRFGHAVDIGTVCSGVTGAVVGSPNEVLVKDHESDGSAWLIPVKKTTGCSARQLYEGHGLSGTPGFRGLGGLLAVIHDAGKSVDDLVVAGRGSFSEGPTGRLFRWSPSLGTTFTYDNYFGWVAGR